MSHDHIISVRVHDRPGVLSRIAQVFARRGYNIDSLVVSSSHTKGFSRMTIGWDQAHTAGRFSSVDASPWSRIASFPLFVERSSTSVTELLNQPSASGFFSSRVFPRSS